jgi:hypothetical protein
MDAKPPRYWFPAKRYGWGWGPPKTWEGWAVLGAWTAVFVLGTFYLIPRTLYVQLAFALAMVGLLLAICYAKGEPPRWRWGERD